MTNGDEIQSDLQFEQLITSFTEPEKFLARQIREVQKRCVTRNCQTFSFTKKQLAGGAGGMAGIAGVVYAIIELIKLFVH